MSYVTTSFLFVCFLLAPGLRHASAAEPTPEQLIAQLPHITLGSPTPAAFHLKGTMFQDPIEYEFELSYAAPNRMKIAVRDAINHTPFMVVINRQTLWFDAIRSRVFVGDNRAAAFVLACRDGQTCDLHWVVDLVPKDDLDLDFKSILEPISWVETPRGEGVYSLVGQSKHGATVSAEFDTRKQFPLLRYQVTTPTFAKPMMKFETAASDRPAGDWRFPRDSLLTSRGLHVEHYDPVDNTANAKFIAASWLFEQALRFPKFRPEVEHAVGDIDWERAAKEYAVSSAALREIAKEFEFFNDQQAGVLRK